MATSSDLVNYLCATLKYFEEDYESMQESKLTHGKCGVPILVYSFSVIDLVAFLKFGTPTTRDTGVGKRLQLLVNDPAYTAGHALPAFDVIYKKIRCGSVHEFFCKGIGITRERANPNLYYTDGTNNTVNVDAVYRWAKHVLSTFIQEVKSSSASPAQLNLGAIFSDWSNLTSTMTPGITAISTITTPPPPITPHP